MPDNETEYIVSKDTTIKDEVNFIETNAEEILSRLISRFEEYTGEVLYPADERRIFLQGFAYVLAEEAIHINETGRGNLLRYATGNQLDAIGDLYSNSRLDEECADVEIKITISAAQTKDITVPKGTRVTPDGSHFFATNNELVFAANTTTLSQTVMATAVVAGTDYNGFVAGQINSLVDTNPYIESVVNTTTSSGGTDVEDDESYRERLQISPFSFSIAGPSEAYRSIALSTSNDIGDALVYSPEGGEVKIVVVKTGGAIPLSNDPLLDEIYKACSAKTVRPLTDHVSVIAATPVDTAINISWYVANEDTSVTAAVIQAVEDYKTWQTAKIGRAVNPDYLRKIMMNAGAARVDITTPVFKTLKNNEIARITTTTVTYAGSISM